MSIELAATEATPCYLQASCWSPCSSPCGSLTPPRWPSWCPLWTPSLESCSVTRRLRAGDPNTTRDSGTCCCWPAPGQLTSAPLGSSSVSRDSHCDTWPWWLSSGTPANLVVLNTLDADYGHGHPLSFASWMAFSVPLMLLNTFLAWGYFSIIIRKSSKITFNWKGSKRNRMSIHRLCRYLHLSTLFWTSS